MAQKFALRRIQHSELPFFQAKLEQAVAEQARTGSGVSKQKAINFDKELIEQYYPGLDEKTKYPVRLIIYGPDDLREYVAEPAPPILLQDKNWRMGGGAVRSPVTDPGRYDRLKVNDYLVFEFLDDDDGLPSVVRMLILSSEFASTNGLTDQLSNFFYRGRRQNFVALSEGQMAGLRLLSRVIPGDPFSIFGDSEGEALEDALLGDADAATYVRRKGRRVTKEQVAQRQLTRATNGDAGELLVRFHFETREQDGEIDWSDYAAETNALESFDFQFETATGEIFFIDVKTTSSIHEAPFYMSAAEINFAAHCEEPYLIYRVSGLAGGTGVLQISGDMKPYAQALLNSLSGLPAGFTPANFKVSPSVLTWSDPLTLHAPVPTADA